MFRFALTQISRWTARCRRPSSAGKPSSGEIAIGGRKIDSVEPYDRNIGMVFQNYALFPHMSVADNVGFPLRMRHVPKALAGKRIADALAMVGLADFSDRKPAELSGGQQQRVALARALVFEPDVVLLDEPLGALDKALREQMQIELKRIHRELGVTMVYATHNQGEAMAMSDRIAVFNRGGSNRSAARRRFMPGPGRASSPPSSATATCSRVSPPVTASSSCRASAPSRPGAATSFPARRSMSSCGPRSSGSAREA